MQRPSTLAASDPEPVGGSSSGNADGSPAPRALASFPKERRIRRRREFGTVFDRGVRIHGRFFTFLMLPTGEPRARLGIVASRKLGGAVERNRAKRLIREFFRCLGGGKGEAIAVDVVVIPKRELLAADFPQLSKDFGATWRRGVERLSASRRG